LQTALQPGVGLVQADPGQLEQVVINLAINARDAMPSGGHLRIDVSNVELSDDDAAPLDGLEAGSYVLLSVSDTGSGIAPEVREHIFEPFFTTKGLGKGTGLGLATVFGIVQQNDGQIEVRSAPGQGSSFSIYLPRSQEKVSTTVAEGRLVAGGGETVLVVEDEELVRKLAARLLRRLGYRVLTAGSGPEALALVDQQDEPFELLLTDIVMPLMNGWELAETLTARSPTTKVLFTSGYTSDVIAKHGVLDQDVRFIAKPYTRETLAAKIRAVLDGV
jgi:two-component system cell cycle sensor histidine kinase/response regulator CckA